MKKYPQKTYIDTARFHTIKKFELIEAYAKAWAPKLLNNNSCKRIVFIDCMCGSGIYRDTNGEEVVGTPIRVASYLSEIMKQYPNKEADCFFNDSVTEKIDILKSRLPCDYKNFHIRTSVICGNKLLKELDKTVSTGNHYLLVYDPYDARVNWEALTPFIKKWSDVIINHMVSDTIRALPQVKSKKAIEKYEVTYSLSIEDLIPFGSNREAYEKRLQEIMMLSRGGANAEYHIASFPFYNTKNTVLYNLVFGSGNINGFELFKKTAWKTFGGRSSTKETRGAEKQLTFTPDGKRLTTPTDHNCYNVGDIAKYLYKIFQGEPEVMRGALWAELTKHPVFPSTGFREQIIQCLKDYFGCKISKSTIRF